MDISCIISSGDLERYVLGQLPPEEAEQVAQLAQIFPEIRKEISAIEQTFERLALAEAVKPSPEVKERLFKQLPPQHTTTSPRATVARHDSSITAFKQQYWKAAAGIIFLIGFAVLSFLVVQNRQLANETSDLRVQLKQKSAELEAASTFARFLQQPGVQTIKLQTVDTTSAPVNVHVYWNPASAIVYLDAAGLPTPPSGFQYQLWCISNSQPVDAGLVPINSMRKFVRMKSCGATDAFAITLEPKGGSLKPTLDKLIVMGNVQG